MKFKKKSIILIYVIASIFVLSACSSGGGKDGAEGTYYFVYEKGPLFVKDNKDYSIVLYGNGKGEYNREGNKHKLKYTFNNPDIEIMDNMTGIKYKGTVSDGDLLFYDGDPDDPTVSEFFFQQ